MGRRNIMPDELLLLIIVLAEAGENSMIRATKMLCSVSCLVTQLCPILCDPMDCSPLGSSVHGDSPGKNIGVGCHTLLWCIFLTQGSNLPLLHPVGFFIPEHWEAQKINYTSIKTKNI